VRSSLPLSPARLTPNSSSLNEITRKGAKSKNTQGSPIKLTSKILAAFPDPQDDDHIYVAEAAGNVKRINIEVGQTSFTSPFTLLYPVLVLALSYP
jgi:hypothetical protein